MVLHAERRAGYSALLFRLFRLFLFPFRRCLHLLLRLLGRQALGDHGVGVLHPVCPLDLVGAVLVDHIVPALRPARLPLRRLADMFFPQLFHLPPLVCAKSSQKITLANGTSPCYNAHIFLKEAPYDAVDDHFCL